MNLVLLDAAEIATDGSTRLRDRRARHLLDVLRVQQGSEVRVGVVDGPLGRATVRCAAPGDVLLDVCLEGPGPAAWADLLLALPRPKALKRLWPQLAALGVGRIAVVNAARVERCYFDTHWLDPRHVRPLLIEGLEQAGATALPAVTVHRELKPLIEDELDSRFPDAPRFLAHPGPAAPPAAAAGHRPLLAVGPEGGWTPYECDLLERHGFRRLSLGPRTLRVDTACVALLAVLHGAVNSTGRERAA